MSDMKQENVQNVIITEFVRFENQFFGVRPVVDEGPCDDEEGCGCVHDQGCCHDRACCGEGSEGSSIDEYDEVNEIINGRYDLLQEYITSKKEPIKNYFKEELTQDF